MNLRGSRQCLDFDAFDPDVNMSLTLTLCVHKQEYMRKVFAFN